MNRRTACAWALGGVSAVAACVAVAPDARAQSAPRPATGTTTSPAAPANGASPAASAPGTAVPPAEAPASSGAGASPSGAGVTPGDAAATTPGATTPAPGAPAAPFVLPPPGPAVLRFQSVSPAHAWQIEVVPPGGGAARRCAVTGRNSCTIGDVTPGAVRFRLRGTSTFEREMEIFEGPSLVRIGHTPPATGVVAGLVTMGIGLAFGGGALALGLACAQPSAMCGNSAVPEPYSAWVIPLAITSVAGLVLGTVMLAWRSPAQDTLEVTLDEAPAAGGGSGAPAASRRALPRRRAAAFGAGVAPVAGGAALGLGVSL